MTEQTASTNKMRYYLFVRSHFLAALGIVLCTSIGLASIQVLLDDSHIKASLTAVFVGMSLIIACTQVVSIHMTSKSIVTPLEKLMESLAEFAKEVGIQNADQIPIERIRQAFRSIQNDAIRYQGKWPAEIQQLQLMFMHTLKTMEKMWEKNEAGVLLVGLGGICGQVAHDMRSPVTSVRLLSKFLLQTENDPEKKEALASMILSAEKLNVMANELLDYRRASNVELKPIILSEVINDVLGELNAGAQLAGILLNVNIDDRIRLQGDHHKLGRVVQNLVQNSIQAVASHAKANSGVEKCHVSIDAKCCENEIILNVSDNGPGLPEDVLKKMFNVGFTTKGKNGNGLGLIYCSNVVKAHGGKIKAMNTVSGGAVFEITLPMGAV